MYVLILRLFIFWNITRKKLGYEDNFSLIQCFSKCEALLGLGDNYGLEKNVKYLYNITDLVNLTKKTNMKPICNCSAIKRKFSTK